MGLRVPFGWLRFSVILSVLAAIVIVKPVDQDFWWHLETGDRILDGGIPQHDPFSWTAGGRPWVAHEWLSEAIISAVQGRFGYGGNLALFILCGAAALALMYAHARRSGPHGRVEIGLVLLSAAIMVFYLAVRPQVFTWALFSLFFVILASNERHDTRAIWVLPPLAALWVNLHLGVVYGLMLVGCWLAARVIRRFRGEPVAITVPAIVLILCVGATLLNPEGWGLWAYPLRYAQDRETLRFVAEWRSPLEQPSVFFIPYYLAFALMAISLLRRRVSLFAALVASIALALSLTALRNVPFVALLLLPVAAPAFAPRHAEARESSVPLPLAAAIALGFLVFAVTGAIQAAGGTSTLGDPPERQYPGEGVEWIAANVPNARLYNEYTWGGYIIYRAPGVPVFIDGRTDFYRERVIRDYAVIGRMDDGWDRLIDKYGIDTMLLRKRSDLANELRASPSWTETYSGDLESVFVKAD